MDTALLIKALGGFFAIMNPFVALPMFLSLTAGYDVKRQRTTAIRVALFSLVLSAVIMAGGKAILNFFGVGIDDFRIAGGIVLMIIALGMLNGSGSTAHTGTKTEQAHEALHAAHSDVSFYPMSFPIRQAPVHDAPGDHDSSDGHDPGGHCRADGAVRDRARVPRAHQLTTDTHSRGSAGTR